jgi:hypothetical protein
MRVPRARNLGRSVVGVLLVATFFLSVQLRWRRRCDAGHDAFDHDRVHDDSTRDDHGGSSRADHG